MINKILRTIKWFSLTVDRAYFRMSKDRQEEIRDFINEHWY
jgi:hypothetical protein